MSEKTEASLRKRAEDQVAAHPPERATTDIHATLHELEVHQIELELQNEELRNAQKALEESRDRFAELYDLSPVGYLSLDTSSIVLEVNLTLCNLLGFERSAVLGKHFSGFVDAADADKFYLYRKSVFDTGARQALELALRKRDGSVLDVRLETIPVAQGLGRAQHGRVAVIDVTQRAATERALEQQREENLRGQEALRVAEARQHTQKMEAIGTLASGVAHDFNNLLMGVYGCAAIATDRLPGEHPVQEQLGEIRDAAEGGAAITRQLMTLARGDASAQTGVSLDAELRRLAPSIRQRLGPDISLELKLAAGATSIFLESGPLEEVLMSLVQNAREAMGTGGKLTIGTASNALAPAHMKPGHCIRLSVSDNGTGMNEETRARASEPFFTTKGVGEGRGLGLTTAYGLVHQVGGTLEIHSVPSRGTTIDLWLPSAERAPEMKTQPSVVVPGTVLLVEDERLVRIAAREFLQGAGYRVLEAEAGPDAIRQCGAFTGEIDLLLTDIVLPTLSGTETARAIIKLKPKTKIVFMSAHPREALVAQGRLTERDRMLQKPFTRDVLLRTVREVLAV